MSEVGVNIALGAAVSSVGWGVASTNVNGCLIHCFCRLDTAGTKYCCHCGSADGWWQPWPSVQVVSPLYITPLPACAKCGSTDLWTRWCRGEDCTDDSYYDGRKFTDQKPPEGEHLDRGCRNCQYRWYGPITGT